MLFAEQLPRAASHPGSRQKTQCCERHLKPSKGQQFNSAALWQPRFDFLLRSRKKWKAWIQLSRTQTRKPCDELPPTDPPGTVLLPSNQAATAAHQRHSELRDVSVWETPAPSCSQQSRSQPRGDGAAVQQQQAEPWQHCAALLGCLDLLSSLRTKTQMSDVRHPVMDLM